ncbi:MAG: Low-specificity L-threonine aldolase [Myxococcaceae bacterium]|nr:Low-specificity L-threonine aldolase [Myxococcaceae bacterium]
MLRRVIIDLRSDTVTRPSPGMRRAMAAAEVGDDVYGEDPTAQRLEHLTAELLGKEAALFVPSGTMANQIALLLHCRPGDAVVVGEGTHLMAFESGAAAAWAGVQFSVAGKGGLFDVAELRDAVQPPHDLLPRSRLVVLENTHNRAGGAVWPRERARAVSQQARELGLALHLDGARLWNAAAATGDSLAELAAIADTVSVCFSKGLGAPVGSALVGSRDAIAAGRRLRKMLGGGMRQVGVLCAAALYAVEQQRERLREDHALARRLAAGLASVAGLSVLPVETNIVLVDLLDRAAAEYVAHLRMRDVLVNAVTPTRLRAVVHRDLEAAHIDAALGAFARA